MRRFSSVGYERPSIMVRSGSKEVEQERGVSREAPSSGALTGRKVLEVGDDGSGHCGICSSYYSVRGVLDCCRHEFCFDCIEHWSSVSNKCPLCKQQFRFISVENVRDEDIVENHRPFSVKQEREEEFWDDEAALPFSFPSDFIDEDAVACLEGSKCLVQAGVPLPDGDAADTSVACDSCDRWYHAGCVGFDPSISWGSWLCPRCSTKAAANKSQQLTASFPLILPPTTVVSASTSGGVSIGDLPSNARLLSEHDPSTSISLMGDKELAVIVSPCRAVDFTVLSARKAEVRQASTVTDSICPDFRGQASVVVKDEEVTYPLLKNKKPVDAPSIPSIFKYDSNDSTRGDFDLLDMAPKRAEPEVAESTDLPASYFDKSIFEEQPSKENRKQTTKQYRFDSFHLSDVRRDFVCTEDLPEPCRRIARSVVKKKELVLGCTSRPSLEKPSVHIRKMDSKAFVMEETRPAIRKEGDVNNPCTKKVLLEDLVHMVKDEPTLELGSVQDGITEGRVRTRVVMRRDTDGRAARIVEDIRQQMRTAAGYGATDDHGKVAISDDSFFSAYKAAMVRSNEKFVAVKSEGFKRRRTSWLDRMLGKTPHGKAGGVRENLTRKLYGGGVSRKSWDRDWDISFWKEQSARMKKAKQGPSDVVEGRASVRAGEFLRDGILVNSKEAAVEKFKYVDAEEDSVLSRLYVADTSLFPRDNDIKPLYLLGDIKEDGNMKCLGREEVAATSEPKGVFKSQTRTDFKSRVTRLTFPSTAGDTTTNMTANSSREGFNSFDASEKTNKGVVERAGLFSTYKHVDVSDIVKALSPPDLDEKKDKRQWARELLARKSEDAIASSAAAKGHGRNEKESSLLGQVPEEMRPTLPPDRRSRVPTAVRQSQLNRILENYLRKEKLTGPLGGYKLKSVISSAVAKELEIYDSSNSKGVYANLCVRALAQQDEGGVRVTIPQLAESERAAAVMEAMLATGLISDSPLGSPGENHNTSTEIGEALFSNQALTFSGNEMKLVRTSQTIKTTSQTINSSQVRKSDTQKPEVSSIGRESNVGATAKGGLAPADHGSRSSISAGRNPYQKDKNVVNQTESVIYGRKRVETSTVAKAWKGCSRVSSVGAQNSKKSESASTIAGAPIQSMAESDGDNGMNSGKFPDLESRIDVMRKDISKITSAFLSQFGEEHVSGGSLYEPTSADEVRLQIGKVVDSFSDDGVLGREGYRSDIGGKECEGLPSVQRQVETYVKEHLKPLYRSGVIKSGQFRFAVSKTASKVMQYHGDATSADFLVVEGSRVKKLADQYLQSYVQKN